MADNMNAKADHMLTMADEMMTTNDPSRAQALSNEIYDDMVAEYKAGRGGALAAALEEEDNHHQTNFSQGDGFLSFDDGSLLFTSKAFHYAVAPTEDLRWGTASRNPQNDPRPSSDRGMRR